MDCNLNNTKKDDGDDDDDDNKRRRQIRRSSTTSSSDLLTRYNKLLDRYPLRTKMCTSFLLSAFGSALGSYLSNAKDSKKGQHRKNGDCKAKSINWVDVLAYAMHGGLINAPISHYWFEWLSLNGPSSSTASVLVDQLVVQPPLLVLMFICLDVLRANIRTTINQFQQSHVISKAVTQAIEVVPNSWRFWPAAVYLTFRYLRKKHYTVALNLCSIGWTVYLSRGGAGGGERDKAS